MVEKICFVCYFCSNFAAIFTKSIINYKQHYRYVLFRNTSTGSHL
jgi:hypothetical protein